MVYGRLGVGLRGGRGNGAKTGSQASNGMQLLDGGEFFLMQCRFPAFQDYVHAVFKSAKILSYKKLKDIITIYYILCYGKY